MKYLSILVFLLCHPVAFPQLPAYTSIHQEESAYYRLHPEEIFTVQPSSVPARGSECMLQKVVFGYHPYWIGNAYLNYQWNLLSDLCYFSYEVDPATGSPSTIHNWLTDPVIDSAQAHDVRTHLCATLFSGHGTFFSNPVSMQTMIDSLIALVQMRNAHGINLDFEAVPAAWGEAMVDFTVDLAQQYHAIEPECIVSMAMPAVDWNGIFDVTILKEHVGIFFIMGYDYYWNGSSQAGPVSPLYSMVGSYNYNLSRSISYYQKQGMPNEKLVVGLPYYGREWATLSGTAPSTITGYGTAYKYSTIRNGSGGNYSPDNRKWEMRSFSTYYAYQVNNDWMQCFLCEVPDLRYRYRVIQQRNLAGIGIWALGYDDGYPELWQLISDNFTDCAIPPCIDTVYDSGGPYWHYYDDETYTISLHSCDETQVNLSFDAFSLENGFDSLWVFDGADTTAPLIGAFSGESLPPRLISTGRDLTLLFYSDDSFRMPGWTGIWESGYVPVEEESPEALAGYLFPNPANTILNISIPEDTRMVVYDRIGRKMEEFRSSEGQTRMQIDVAGYPHGLYVIGYSDRLGTYKKRLFVVAH